jgi:hypothetical protein
MSRGGALCGRLAGSAGGDGRRDGGVGGRYRPAVSLDCPPNPTSLSRPSKHAVSPTTPIGNRNHGERSATLLGIVHVRDRRSGRDDATRPQSRTEMPGANIRPTKVPTADRSLPNLVHLSPAGRIRRFSRPTPNKGGCHGKLR